MRRPPLRRLDAAAAIARVPILLPEWIAGAVLDESGCDMDVAAIHQGCLRVARRAGTQRVLGAAEVVLARQAAGRRRRRDRVRQARRRPVAAVAGQGGYGIQMAPALARAAAALLLGLALPADITAQGAGAEDISPARAALREPRGA